MHKNLYSLLFLLSAATVARAQVSPIIDRTDMPAVTTALPVDTMRISQAAAALPAGAPLLTQRGANQTWNYSTLVATSQTVDRYISVAATGAPIYQFTFGVLGGVNRATVASPEPLPLAGPGLPVITDPYQFYSVSAATAANQDYRSVGFGGTLGGLQVPLTYRSQAEQDVIYRFPLSFASRPDSSRSYFETPGALAATGYFSRRRKRVNTVDAWGTLTTPFGTFQTVRVVSKLADHDSIAFGGAPGTGFDVPLTREYKWLAKTHHVPVLTITTQVLAGRETITAVQYRDRYRRIVRTATRASAAEAAVAVYPNPLGTGPLQLAGLTGTTVTVKATDLTGRVLFALPLPVQQAGAAVPAAAFGEFRGVMLLTVQTDQGVAVRRVVRQ
ncbi:T9SS type A sorting domain-containing protein [Hymenobacter sp. BT175]|uniref:T9SS type A sorting domain-containing protein n=1 Tax=Hymenobacter translucens TaxID=2886507 RepID=UPI001D0EAFA6|nr:T9SS type A sorting domain-containing protein [Hymenobacter translucens]MCC2547087.1 T9SS type A sorting domain-containing protein [Hymenobacter translucens]